MATQRGRRRGEARQATQWSAAENKRGAGRPRRDRRRQLPTTVHTGELLDAFTMSVVAKAKSKSVSKVIQMIRQIKDHPEIWQSSHKRYKDKLARERAWKEIAKTLNKDGSYLLPTLESRRVAARSKWRREFAALVP